jgi:squalene-associated FAD-dependent desaturase
MKVAVIGGGISGLRAALTLSRAGCDVTLLEKNRHLGGRVFSFVTPDFGEVDIGQHIWLRCCTAFEGLLRDLGVPDDWVYRQERVAMPYRRPDGSVFQLAAGRLPGMLALLPSLLRAPGLDLRDKLMYLVGSARARLYSDRQVEALDRISVADWLRAQRQPPAVVEWFWEPFIVGVCNGRLAEVSARHALAVARESLFRSPEAAAICLLRRPLSAVFDRLARQVLEEAGVAVRTGEQVTDISPGAAVTVRTASGRKHAFERVVLALPLKRMRGVLPDVELPPAPEEGAIAGLLLRFARPVMEELFFTALGSPVQHVFDKSTILGQATDGGPQVVELVLSAAEREVRLGVERVAAELLPELAKLLPRVRTTPVLNQRLLVHATATFRVTPGGEAGRLPVTRAGVPNVFFAGDYAATGFPSTMESAALAGQAAAQAVLAARDHPSRSASSSQ